MTQEMLIMAAILVAVILLTLLVSFRATANVRVMKSSLYMVKQEEIKSRQSYIMVARLLYGRLFRDTNSCP